jgi:hypothetical protein
MLPSELILNKKYKIPGCKNVFTLFRTFDFNKKCFRRQDLEEHFGREFVEYRNGLVFLELEPLKNTRDPHWKINLDWAQRIVNKFKRR